MMSYPLITAIITTYNRTDLLKQAIESVLAQDYPNLELVVIDDCSTDTRTIDLCTGYTMEEPQKVRYIRLPKNSGGPVARNTGIEAARGKYIAFLDDDDMWVSTKLSKQYELISKSPSSVKLVYCWVDIIAGEQKIGELNPTLRGNILRKAIPTQPISSLSSWLIDKEAFEKVRFDETLPRGQDGDFLRCYSRYYDVDYVPEQLLIYRTQHGYSRITSTSIKGHKNAIVSALRKLEKFKTELEHLPKEKAEIYRYISNEYIEIGDQTNSIKYAFMAIICNPVNYDSIKRLIKSLLKRR